MKIFRGKGKTVPGKGNKTTSWKNKIFQGKGYDSGKRKDRPGKKEQTIWKRKIFLGKGKTCPGKGKLIL